MSSGDRMSLPVVTLRAACQTDAEQLLRWRNDPLAVMMSKTLRPVELDEHLAWLDDVFSKKVPVHVFVIQSASEGIGFCRVALQEHGTVGYLSIIIARKHRDMHNGWEALDLLIGKAHGLLVAKLKASIKRENIASRRLFSRFGFTIANDPSSEWLDYERPL